MSPRAIGDPGFAGDTGAADAALARVLAEHAAGRADTHQVHERLSAARLLVPVIAGGAGGVGAGGAGDAADGAETEMQVATLVGRDGRRALPAFTGLSALAAWRPDARPVPVPARRAALSAYAEGADALVVDVAGPARYVLDGPGLRALADGRRWLPPERDPEVTAAVSAALAGLPGVEAVTVGRSSGGHVAVRLRCTPVADLEALRSASADRLAGLDLLRARLDGGLDVTAELTT